MRVSRTPVAAAVGAVLALAGCGGGGAGADPEPIIPSSSSADPSPSEPSESEDTDAAPVMPDAAKERSAEGVEDFLGYWAEALTYSTNTGDPKSLELIFNPGCDSCESTYEFLEEIYGSGGSIENAGWSVRQVVFGEDITRPLAKFDRGLEVVRRSDARPDRYPPAVPTLAFELRWQDGAWTIDQFTQRS